MDDTRLFGSVDHIRLRIREVARDNSSLIRVAASVYHAD